MRNLQGRPGLMVERALSVALVAGVQENGDSAARRVRHRQIELAVAVKVLRDYEKGSRAGSEIERHTERAVTITE